MQLVVALALRGAQAPLAQGWPLRQQRMMQSHCCQMDEACLARRPQWKALCWWQLVMHTSRKRLPPASAACLSSA